MIPRYPVRLTIPGQAPRNVEPWEFRELSHEVQIALGLARRAGGHAWCLCRSGENAPRLSIRVLGSTCTLALWPGEGPLHAADCLFAADPPAIVARTVARPALEDLFHILWEQAGLTEWKPTYRPARRWRIVATRLAAAARNLQVGEEANMGGNLAVLAPDMVARSGGVLQSAAAGRRTAFALGVIERCGSGQRARRVRMRGDQAHGLTLFARLDAVIPGLPTGAADRPPSDRRWCGLFRIAVRRSADVPHYVADIRAGAVLDCLREYVPAGPEPWLVRRLIAERRAFRVPLARPGPAAVLDDVAGGALPLYMPSVGGVHPDDRKHILERCDAPLPR